MLPEKDIPSFKVKLAFAVTSMLLTPPQMSEGMSPLATSSPVTVSLPSLESSQPSPLSTISSAISMAFASGGVSVTRICGRETPSASA